MSDDYAPFPVADLEALAAYHESAAKAYGERSYVRFLHDARALACRNAVKSFDALRERCLTAETQLTVFEASVKRHTDPDLWPWLLGDAP